jgi:hypothetical protein
LEFSLLTPVVRRAARQGTLVFLLSAAGEVLLLVLLGKDLRDAWPNALLFGAFAVFLYLTGRYERWAHWSYYNWRHKKGQERPPTPF